jgi:hypothetical protein
MAHTFDQPSPLLSIPADHQPLNVRINGIDVAVLTWAAIPRAKVDAPAALIHFSAVGPYAPLKAVWAHLLHVPARIMSLPLATNPHERLRISRLSSLHGRYRTHWNAEPLPQSGQSHLSITHDVALDAAAGSGVALLQPLNGPLDTELFVALLDRRLAVPLPPEVRDPDVAAQIWANAIDAGAITPLPAFGCQAYWLATEHPAWPHLLVAALRDQALADVPLPQVTTHGSAHTISVAITAVDDEEADAAQERV